MAVATTPSVGVMGPPTSYSYSTTGALKSLKTPGKYYWFERVTPASGFWGHVWIVNSRVDMYVSNDYCKTWQYVKNVIAPNASYDIVVAGGSVGINSLGEEVVFILVGRVFDSNANSRAPICVIYTKDGGTTFSNFYDMTAGVWPGLPNSECISYDGSPWNSNSIVLSNGTVIFGIQNHLAKIIYTLRCHIDNIDTVGAWIPTKGYTDVANTFLTEPATCELKTNGVFSGRVLRLLREEETLDTWAQTSDDYGLTWTTPVNTGLMVSPIPHGYPPTLVRLHDNRIVCVLGRKVFKVFVSLNEGVDWVEKTELINWPISEECSYNGIVETKNNWLFMSWGNTGMDEVLGRGFRSYQYGNFYYIK